MIFKSNFLNIFSIFLSNFIIFLPTNDISLNTGEWSNQIIMRRLKHSYIFHSIKFNFSNITISSPIIEYILIDYQSLYILVFLSLIKRFTIIKYKKINFHNLITQVFSNPTYIKHCCIKFEISQHLSKYFHIHTKFLLLNYVLIVKTLFS